MCVWMYDVLSFYPQHCLFDNAKIIVSVRVHITRLGEVKNLTIQANFTLWVGCGVAAM